MVERVLVIGGSGFIGTPLVSALLAGGDDVLIYDKKLSLTHPDITMLGDVRALDTLRVACMGKTLVYNLAAEHRDDVSPATLYTEVNVGGAETVCRAAEENDISRIVFASSVSVYGPGQSALHEESPHNYINKYGESKSKAEGVYKEWQRLGFGRSLVIVRPTAIFGPGSSGNVNNLISQINNGKFVMVGSGNNKKSIGYVINVAEFFASMKALRPGVHVYNYADKPDFAMNELVAVISRCTNNTNSLRLHLPKWVGITLGAGFDLVSRVAGVSFSINRERVEKFCSSTEISADKAFATGFCPRFTIEQALQLTVSEFVDDGTAQ